IDLTIRVQPFPELMLSMYSGFRNGIPSAVIQALAFISCYFAIPFITSGIEYPKIIRKVDDALRHQFPIPTALPGLTLTNNRRVTESIVVVRPSIFLNL